MKKLLIFNLFNIFFFSLFSVDDKSDSDWEKNLTVFHNDSHTDYQVYVNCNGSPWSEAFGVKGSALEINKRHWESKLDLIKRSVGYSKIPIRNEFYGCRIILAPVGKGHYLFISPGSKASGRCEAFWMKGPNDLKVAVIKAEDLLQELTGNEDIDSLMDSKKKSIRLCGVNGAELKIFINDDGFKLKAEDRASMLDKDLNLFEEKKIGDRNDINIPSQSFIKVVDNKNPKVHYKLNYLNYEALITKNSKLNAREFIKLKPSQLLSLVSLDDEQLFPSVYLMMGDGEASGKCDGPEIPYYIKIWQEKPDVLISQQNFVKICPKDDVVDLQLTINPDGSIKLETSRGAKILD